MSNELDILENDILQYDPKLLQLLLIDRSKPKRNGKFCSIIWATDNYESRGKGYLENDEISIDCISGNNGDLIQPRVRKTKEEYQAYVRGCKMICGDVVAAFIRSIVGIDRDKALQKYGKVLTNTVLIPEQEEYLGTIISYVCENGDITGNTMVNERPFVDFQWQQVFGSDLMNVSRFINNLHNVIVA